MLFTNDTTKSHKSKKSTEPILIKKILFYWNRDSHYKPDRLRYIMGIPIPQEDVFFVNRGPGVCMIITGAMAFQSRQMDCLTDRIMRQ